MDETNPRIMGNEAESVISSDEISKLDAYWRAAHVKQWIHNKPIEHKQYIREHGEDMPEIRDWKWPY